jgi:hypothetical protein
MIFLFPSLDNTLRQVDPNFDGEYQIARALGATTYLFDHDGFIYDGSIKTNLPKQEDKVDIILRSWMLKSFKYEILWNYLNDEKNCLLVNSPEQYLNTHYYSRSYPILKDIMAPSKILLNFDDSTLLENKPSEKFIIKDLVKSERDCFTIPVDNDDVYLSKVKEFIELRGRLFYPGLVFKKIMPLKKYDGKTNEIRCFIHRGNILYISNNSNLDQFKIDEKWLKLIEEAIPKIDSNFWTIDLAELENGDWFVLETGDGGVSGLPTGSKARVFYTLLINYDKFI